MKAIRDDNKVLALAFKDGCHQTLIDKMTSGEGTALVICGLRIYVVSTQRHDAGYLCVEVDHPRDLLAVIDRLKDTCGETVEVQMRPCEHAPDQRGATH